MSNATPVREFVIEMVPNEDFYLLWDRIDIEFEENDEIYMVWDDNDTYRKS